MSDPAGSRPDNDAGDSDERPGRRDVLRGLTMGAGLVGFGALAGGTVAGLIVSQSSSPDAQTAGREPAQPTVDPFGANQAGIDRPGTPQPNGELVAYDLSNQDPAALTEVLATLSSIIGGLTTGTVAELPDGPSDLTVTVGIGPAVVRALYGADAPGASELPVFASDNTLAEQNTGGDLLIAAHSSDPNVVAGAILAVQTGVPTLRPRWSQRGFRAPGEGTVARNPLAFHDGVIVPRGTDEMAENVWLSSGPAAGGTICVIRRIVLDATAFRAKPIDRQEQIIGRKRSTGAPLTGGGPRAHVDLLAKTPVGELITPARSHVRAAHPSFTGSALMLRRGYAFDNGNGDAGLMFICFQRDLRTFVQTQYRLEETDDLLEYMTVTASATFLILPGFTPQQPLGA